MELVKLWTNAEDYKSYNKCLISQCISIKSTDVSTKSLVALIWTVQLHAIL